MKLINIFKIRKILIGFLCFLFLFFVSGLSADKADAAIGILGTFEDSVHMDGAWHSTISGNYAYVAAPNSNCLTILDISIVTNPTYKGSVCDGARIGGAYNVFVYGNYAYLTARTAKSFSIIDVADPANPEIKSTIYESGDARIGTPIGVFVSGNYAFVATHYRMGLTAINISDPLNPFVVSEITDARLNGAWDLKIVGNLAYVTSRIANRLSIVNVSNPAAMSILGSVNDNEKLNTAYSVDTSGGYAYVTARDDGHDGPFDVNGDRLTVVDIFNPAAPQVRGSVRDLNYLNGAKGVKVFGSVAYVTGYDSDTLTTVNIVDPLNPFVDVGQSLQDPVILNQVYGLSFRSGYLYVSSEEPGIGRLSIISGIPDTINPNLTTEAWRPDSVGIQVANGGTVNYADIDQAGEKVTIYSTASDDSGTVVDHKIRWWKNGVLQPVSSWATGGLHSVAINGPLAPGDVIEYQSEATDGLGNVTLNPLSGRYSFTVSISSCCPAAGNCTITQNPCYLGGSHTGVAIDVNVNTSNPLRIILSSDLDLTGTDFDFRNKSVGSNTEVIIDGKPTLSETRAKNIDMAGGDIYYPLGGLTIDLSVPDNQTGDGGHLDIAGTSGIATFPSNANLKIYTQGSNFAAGPAKVGGYVKASFSSDTLFGGASVIKTGNINIAGVNGGVVELKGSGNVGITSSVNFITTSSSRKAGNVKITGSGFYKGGIHANSCENFAGCGQIGGTIDLTGLDNYYAPDCATPVLEAKEGGLIDWSGPGFFDLPPTTSTGSGGTLKVTGATLSNCSCKSTGGACWTQLGLNNSTLDFTGEDCNESNPLAACSGSGGSSPQKVMGLSASPGNAQIVLNWTAPADGGSPITNYKVYRSTTSGAEVLVVAGGCSSLGNVLTCTDSGLTNGTMYYYKVSAVNVIGEGPQSDEANATPSAPMPPMNTCAGVPVVNLEGKSYGNVQIGNQCWMDRNMNRGNLILASTNIPWFVGLDQSNDGAIEKYCYNNVAANCDDPATNPQAGNPYSDGGLYMWAEAMQLPFSCNTTDCSASITYPRQGICPAGWHVPQMCEYDKLENYVISTYGANGEEELREGRPTEFNAPWAGSYTYGARFFDRWDGVDGDNKLWSSVQQGAIAGDTPELTAATKYLYSDGVGLVGDSNRKLDGNSVRCVLNTFAYSLSNSGNVTLVQGNSGSNTITATLISGTANPVNLSYDIVPAESNITLSWPTGNSVTPTNSKDLNINVGAATPTGVYAITVSGNSTASCDNPTTFNLTVNSSSNNPPTLVINEPQGDNDTIALNGTFNIAYNLSDLEDNATVSFYYDNNGAGNDGILIGGCLNRPETSGAVCAWDTTGVFAGTYYIYGKASDGVNPDIYVYSDTVVIATSFSYTISDPADVILIPSSNATVNVTLTKISGNMQNVALDASSAPSDVVFSWAGGTDSCSPNPNCTLGLDINVGSSPTPWSYVITITGSTVGLADQPVSFNLEIIGASESGNLEGFAWSDTVGWISFSSKDCDTDNDGTFEGNSEDGGPAPAGCPSSGAAFTYSVQIDIDSDILSGYAWSDKIGWISFESASIAGCPSGTCDPRLDVNEFKGWARACSVFQNSNPVDNGCSGALKLPEKTGGWDGWISLNESDCDVQGGGPNGFLDVTCGGDNATRMLNDCDVNDNGWLDGACGGDDSSDIANSCDVDNNDFLDVACGGVDNASIPINVGYKVSYADPNLSGWAWGGDVVGWINFDGVRVRTGDNKPILTLFGQTPIDYCTKNLPGAVSIRWDFNDFEDGYRAQNVGGSMVYEIELTRNPDGVVCSSGKRTSTSTTLLGTEINNFDTVPDDLGNTDADCANFIDYGGYTYNWKLRVFDSDNNFNSGSVDGFLYPGVPPGVPPGISFPVNGPTPDHQYPIANFSVDPDDNWIALMPITFDPFNDANGVPLAVPTESFGGTQIAELEWNFGDGELRADPAVPIDNAAPGDHSTVKNDYDIGIYTVDLRVKDTSNYECYASDTGHARSVDVMSNKPKWNEAAP